MFLERRKYLQNLLEDCTCFKCIKTLTLLHSERPKLYTILAFLSAMGLIKKKKKRRKCGFCIFNFELNQTLSDE